MRRLRERWLKHDAGALGIYLTLLYVRFHNQDKKMVRKAVKNEIDRLLLNEEERSKAWQVAERFISKLYKYYPKVKGRFKNKDKVNLYLEMKERQYYDRFKEVCYKYLNQNIINDYKKEIVLILKKAKSRSAYRTSCGSTYYLLENKDINIDKFLIKKVLINSGIIWFGYIIPAPFLEDKFIENLELEVEEEYEGESEKLSFNDILELIAKILENFGFKVEIKKTVKTKSGVEIDVDIWGIKELKNTTLYLYISCKNWDKKVDIDKIFSEIGKIMSLEYYPHFKILICRELDDNSELIKKIASTQGITIIELKEKANSKNPYEIANLIYKHLTTLFIGIASPELQRIARNIAENLKNLAGEIDKLTKYY